jgi:hypothetical protein
MPRIRLQRLSLDVLHRHVEHAILFSGVIDGDNVGMVEYAGGAGFVLETAHHFLRVQSVDVEPHRFKCYGPADCGIQRLVHDAHRAAAQLAGYLISANRL